MKIPDFIKNPFFLVSVVIIIAIIIYFIVSKSSPNFRSSCKSDEDIINGKCVPKCQSGKKRCGNTINCYDPLQQYCDSSTFETCDIVNSYCGKCCKENSSCKNGVCIECDNKFKCGTECCNDNKPFCCNEKECCTKDNICTKDGCCELPNIKCGDNCCNSEAGLICDNGECKIGCPSPDPNTGKLPDGFTGTPIACDINKSVCFKNPTIKDINKQYQCLPKGCDWGDVYYTPEQDYKDFDGKPIHVCQDNSNNLWISKQNMSDLSSTVNVDIKNFDANKCTNDTCFQKIYQDGSTEVKGLNITSGEIKDNKCTSELLCSNLLISNDDQTRLKDVCYNTKSSLNGKCCIKNNIYTGQICIPTASCATGRCRCVIPGKKGDNCQYSRENTCNNYGNPDDDGNCTCDIYCKKTPSGGCERILARDFFEANAGYGSGLIYNWFMTFINVNGDIITFKDSNMMQNEVIGWESLFVFQIGNMPYNTVQWTAMKQPGIGKRTTGQGYSTVLPEFFPIPGYKGSWKCNIYSSFVNGSTHFVNFMLSNLSGKNICGVSMANIRDSSTLTFNCGTSPLPYKFYEPGTFFNSSPAILIFYGSTYLNGTN